MNKYALVILAGVLSSQTASAEPAIQSSFAGLNLDISGVRLDLPIDQSMRAVQPRKRLNRARWGVGPRHLSRQQLSTQGWTKGTIRGVYERMTVSPTHWHTGSLIRRVERKVIIKPANQRPRVSDTRQSILTKYGMPTTEKKKGVKPRLTEMHYTIKNGQFLKVPCFKYRRYFYSSQDNGDKRIKNFERVLKKINQYGYCDAVLILYYHPHYENAERVGKYGAYMRDFKLEALSIIADIKKKRALLQNYRNNLPNVKPRL